jgi:hypothetical protein
MPMMPDAAELTDGVIKTTYHCIKCGTESECVAKTETPVIATATVVLCVI